MKNRLFSIKSTSLLLVGLSLAACQQHSVRESINLTTYAPVIDLKDIDHNTYQADLRDCVALGHRVQTQYAEQRAKEREAATNRAIAGIFIGALAGHALAQNNDYHSGRGATTGAIYGAAIAGSQGAEAIDYTRIMAKFGPTAIVDRCMTGRGYKILSAEGFGGG